MKNINHKKAREFSNFELLAKQVVEGFITGLHKSPFHGFSVEFSEHSLYNKGESTKHIDWKLFARTDKLFNKRYEEETNLRCQIVIDTSSSMYFPENQDYNKLSFTIDASAALIYLMRKQRDAVGLSLFDDEIKIHTKAASSLTNQRILFSELEKYICNYNLKDSHSTDIVNSLHHIAEMSHKRSLVIIFSDLLGNTDKLNDALQHLKYNKHEVILFHLSHSELEDNLAYENRPHTFIDMETGKTIKLNPSQIQERYAEIKNIKNKNLNNICTKNKIDYIFSDINKGFHQILLQYIIKRNKMK